MDLPEHVGDYAVERELGAGGMGTVYLARSRGGRAVAVKVARPELAADPHFRARFRAEADAARRVGGFHTAQVIDADPEAQAPWMATAYIAGPTLSELLAEQGPMGEAALRALGAALAEALQAIHACGLVHRDLKPGIIIMADDGPRVLDFGIARALESTRLTHTGGAFGTPGFLAPEQAQGFAVGPAADVFALGAVLVAAAGGRAFGEGTPMGQMYRAVHEEPDLSRVPPGVRPVVVACLAKNPAERPTPEELLDLFAPRGPARRSTSPRPTSAGHPPTVPDGAAAPVVMPTATAAAPVADDGGVAGAPTVTALPEDSSRAASSDAEAGSPPRPRRLLRGRRRTVAMVAAVLLLGGALFGAYELTDMSFPQATHELAVPETLLEGSYRRSSTLSSGPDAPEDGLFERDVQGLMAYYFPHNSEAENQALNSSDALTVFAKFGRFKFVDAKRDSYMSADGADDQVIEPARMISVPGADVRFRCTETSMNTICGWGDTSTIASVSFPNSTSSEEAAAMTHKIRNDMRKPIARNS
ncbi:serine/threonine protein kinase [Streptomyces venezuelae]|uniref:serine/threonine protein kinase n=1 Tax=Streptomyces venezuelae TaxID=54571 RepID=UPI0037D04F9F